MSALAPTLDLAQVNAELGRDAQALVNWAVGLDLPTINAMLADRTAWEPTA